MTAALDVQSLRVGFGPAAEVVRGISFQVERGSTHCLVGESGCGKSLTSLAVMGLLPKGAHRSAAKIALGGTDIAELRERPLRRLRGDKLAMIFQEPTTSLNPAYTIGSQMGETYVRHRGATRRAARDRAAALLHRVGVAAPGLRLGQYPHELSGGLRQRVMIAMALMCDPELLIADEPTTALDVTVQAQILALLTSLQQQNGLSILLITHDLGVVARMADHVSVMYAGEIVETAPARTLFATPSHPYTSALLRCIPVPGLVRKGEPLVALPGMVPRLPVGYQGCGFRDRCPQAALVCEQPIPWHTPGPAHEVLCTGGIAGRIGRAA